MGIIACMEPNLPSHERITWAPKVRQAKIWQLYQNDAHGTVDEALVEDVGYRLLQRCRSIQLATNRGLECPRCGTVFKIPESEPWRLLPGAHPCPEPGLRLGDNRRGVACFLASP